MLYPFFSLDKQNIEDIEMYLDVEVYDPIDKYRNVQFLLHLLKLLGKEQVIFFLTNFIYDDPDLFLRENLR